MRFIILDENNKVINTRQGTSIVDGEIESETGELGDTMQPDGTFVTPPPANPPGPTVEEQVAELKSQNADIIFALVSNDLM